MGDKDYAAEEFGVVKHPHLHVCEVVKAGAATIGESGAGYAAVVQCIGNAKHDAVGQPQQKRGKNNADGAHYLTTDVLDALPRRIVQLAVPL